MHEPATSSGRLSNGVRLSIFYDRVELRRCESGFPSPVGSWAKKGADYGDRICAKEKATAPDEWSSDAVPLCTIEPSTSFPTINRGLMQM